MAYKVLDSMGRLPEQMQSLASKIYTECMDLCSIARHLTAGKLQDLTSVLAVENCNSS